MLYTACYLSWLARGDVPDDAKLQQHFRDFENDLASRYGNSHDAAFRESRIPKLQGEVLSFLNDRLRRTTLETAIQDAEQNFCQPLLHHMRVCKESDESLLAGELKTREKDKARMLTGKLLQKRREELKTTFQHLRDTVATERRGMFADRLISSSASGRRSRAAARPTPTRFTSGSSRISRCGSSPTTSRSKCGWSTTSTPS